MESTNSEKKEYTIEESVTNKPRFIHRASFTGKTVPIVPPIGNKAFRNSFTGKNDKRSLATIGNPSFFGSNPLSDITIDYNKKPTIDSIPGLQEPDITDPLLQEPTSKQDITKSRSSTDGELVPMDEHLKEKLAEAFSPSPFRNEDPNVREEQLDKLVASSPSTSKTILFYPFYGTEKLGEGGHHAWKIALKDHIVHTLESICLIEKLIPVPNHIIEKRMLPPDTWTSIVFR